MSVRVLSVASEVYPVIKTGGLADVAGALPLALKAEGVEVATLVPGYPGGTNVIGTAASRARPSADWTLVLRDIVSCAA